MKSFTKPQLMLLMWLARKQGDTASYKLYKQLMMVAIYESNVPHDSTQ